MKSFNLILVILILIATSCKNEITNNTIPDIIEIENGLLPPVLVKGDSAKSFNLMERMELYNVPGISIAIVENGKIKWARGYGIANTKDSSEVNANTLFQAGSISKPVAALAALKLVESGSVDIDEDVNIYLKEWNIPENDFTQEEKVTLKRLLTHTAGMTVHGFPGYQQTDTFPSINDVLNGNGNTPKIFVDTIPGSIWRYSGGGYTVMEKMVEDVSGLPLDEYMSKNILEAIGMKNSTYEQPLSSKYHSNASAAYDSDGKIIEGLWHNYPEQAAAGLWTTPTDLAKYCIEIQQIVAGKKNGVLSKETIAKMLTKHKNDWGLGPSIQWEQDSLIFRHGGKNAGFTNNLISFANRGNAVIVMTNADNGGKLIGEILRAVSNYYNWGINNPKVVDVIEVEEEKLNNLVGKYLLDFQVPDIGDYIIDIEIKNDKIFVSDPNNGDSNILSAIEELKFIDLENGDEVVFQLEEDKVGILWNNRFQFNKIE
ncbi:serine hydrolase domain-containing protein [Neolewinella persica]|uniref:serine hydrolase domain-containing protein n=1 Tax=Neolewinella persica TaxID=70998 RepID=UPI00036D320D|nr:serine hydrolase domain-containing protein [Neolewinella persica]